MKKFKLNADMAEGYGDWKIGEDSKLLDIISTANLACGFHAGDYNILGITMKMAKEKNVSVGSHPGFYDLHGFGRRKLNLNLSEIERLIAYQLGASMGIASLYDVVLTHIKPHGALNNMACVDKELSQSIMRGVKAVDKSIIVLAPALSHLLYQAEKNGLNYAIEVFADRAYLSDGQLAPRSTEGALIIEPQECLNHCKSMFLENKIISIDKKVLKVEPDSVCVHGDSLHSLAVAKKVRKGLEEEGLTLKTLPEIIFNN